MSVSLLGRSCIQRLSGMHRRWPNGAHMWRRSVANVGQTQPVAASETKQVKTEEASPEERNRLAHQRLKAEYTRNLKAQESLLEQQQKQASEEKEDNDKDKKKEGKKVKRKEREDKEEDKVKQVTSIPRRAVMYVPGDDARKLGKIAQLDVDCPVLECEDGVALTRKEAAREGIGKALDSAPWVQARLQQGRDVAVRINALQSGLAQADLAAVLTAGSLPSTLLVPKVEDKEQVTELADLLHQHLQQRPRAPTGPLRLIMYTESARALLQLLKTLKTALKLADKSAGLFQLDGMVLGSDDLCADMGAQRSKEAGELVFARQYFLAVVKSFQRQLQAIDLVYIDYNDPAGLKRQAEEGAQWGFTGKQVIHPGQVAIVQEAFAPSSAKVQWARELLAAFEQHQQEGKGAFTFRDSMIDMPLVLQARNILEQHQAFSADHEKATSTPTPPVKPSGR